MKFDLLAKNPQSKARAGSITTKSYFLNNWNYADFLIYHKRKDDAAVQLPKVEALVASPSDRKEFNKLQKGFDALK